MTHADLLTHLTHDPPTHGQLFHFSLFSAFYECSDGQWRRKCPKRTSTRAQQLLRWATVWPQYAWAEKCGAAVPLSMGELGPHLTQCGLDRGLSLYQVASWSIQPFGYNTPMLHTQRQTDVTGRQTGQTTVPYLRANRFTNGRPKMLLQNVRFLNSWVPVRPKCPKLALHADSALVVLWRVALQS